MTQPSIKSDAEIRLLTEMLAEHDSFAEEGDATPHADDNFTGCPAPAVLWALFEPETEETTWTARMRNHVKQCADCGPLTQSLQGFVAASDEGSPLHAEYEAAWKSAENRMERNIQNILALNTKSKPEPFWKLRWLPSMQLAYALGGCAALLLLISGITLYQEGKKQEAGSGQIAQSDAYIWSQPAAASDTPQAPNTTEQAASGDRVPATPIGNESPQQLTDGQIAGSVAAGEPAAAPHPPAVASAGNTGATPGSEGPSAGYESGGTITTSSKAAGPPIETVSLLLRAGMDATVQILLVHKEGTGTMIEGTLTPSASSGSPSAIFSARIGDGSVPVKLQIHMLELDGKRMKLQGGVSAITVKWPVSARQPLPGQSLEVRVANGAKLVSEGKSK